MKTAPFTLASPPPNCLWSKLRSQALLQQGPGFSYGPHPWCHAHRGHYTNIVVQGKGLMWTGTAIRCSANELDRSGQCLPISALIGAQGSAPSIPAKGYLLASHISAAFSQAWPLKSAAPHAPLVDQLKGGPNCSNSLLHSSPLGKKRTAWPRHSPNHSSNTAGDRAQGAVQAGHC